tara:strand:+ start:1050 stop:1316 length:267 start_codon:yes stop_codon:yes gene_type:complete
MKDKKYITVLDSEKSKVFQYELIEWFKNTEDAEQFLDDKGHNMTNCQWMETNGEIITFNHSDDVFDYGYKRNLDRYDINTDGTREIVG